MLSAENNFIINKKLLDENRKFIRRILSNYLAMQINFLNQSRNKIVIFVMKKS